MMAKSRAVVIGSTGRATFGPEAAAELRRLGFDRHVIGTVEQWERPGQSAAHLIYVSDVAPHDQPYVVERWEQGVRKVRIRYATAWGAVEAVRFLIGPIGV